MGLQTGVRGAAGLGAWGGSAGGRRAEAEDRVARQQPRVLRGRVGRGRQRDEGKGQLLGLEGPGLGGGGGGLRGLPLLLLLLGELASRARLRRAPLTLDLRGEGRLVLGVCRLGLLQQRLAPLGLLRQLAALVLLVVRLARGRLLGGARRGALGPILAPLLLPHGGAPLGLRRHLRALLIRVGVVVAAPLGDAPPHGILVALVARGVAVARRARRHAPIAIPRHGARLLDPREPGGPPPAVHERARVGHDDHAPLGTREQHLVERGVTR